MKKIFNHLTLNISIGKNHEIYYFPGFYSPLGDNRGANGEHFKIKIDYIFN